MRAALAILILAIATNTFAQTTGSAAANGVCSIANTGSNVTQLTIQCGIGQQQGKTIIQILNTMLANQIDPSAVMNKLDEILAAEKQAQANAGTVTGSDNTVVNDPRSINGEGNTIVGADANGNLIVPTGTTIGRNARGNPDMVTIGAGANGGMQATDHGIINNTPNSGQQTVEDNRQYGVPRPAPPVRILEQEVIDPVTNPTLDPDPATNAMMLRRFLAWAGNDKTHPGVLLTITVDDGFYNPAFWVKCSGPCRIAGGPLNMFSFTSGLGSSKDAAISGIRLVDPNQIPSGTKIILQIRSTNSNPISIVGVGPYAPELK